MRQPFANLSTNLLMFSQSEKYVHRFDRVYATTAADQEGNFSYLPMLMSAIWKTGKDKQIILWDQLDTFSKLGEHVHRFYRIQSGKYVHRFDSLCDQEGNFSYLPMLISATWRR